MADLCQVIFSQTGHFHYGIAVDAVLQHGTGYFQSSLALTFIFTEEQTETINTGVDMTGKPL